MMTTDNIWHLNEEVIDSYVLGQEQGNPGAHNWQRLHQYNAETALINVIICSRYRP